MGQCLAAPCGVRSCGVNKEDVKQGCFEGWTSPGVPIFGGGAFWGAGGGGGGGFGGHHHGGGGGGDDGGGGGVA